METRTSIEKNFPQLNGNCTFRKVMFTLCVDGAPFVKDMQGLDRAISAFLYLCFIANLEYPQVPILNNCVMKLSFRYCFFL